MCLLNCHGASRVRPDRSLDTCRTPPGSYSGTRAVANTVVEAAAGDEADVRYGKRRAPLALLADHVAYALRAGGTIPLERELLGPLVQQDPTAAVEEP